MTGLIEINSNIYNQLHSPVQKPQLDLTTVSPVPGEAGVSAPFHSLLPESSHVLPCLSVKTKMIPQEEYDFFSTSSSFFFKCFPKYSKSYNRCLTFRNAVKWLNLLQRPFLTEGLKIKPLGFSLHKPLSSLPGGLVPV